MDDPRPVRTCTSLEEVRAEIDRLDAAVIALLAERAAYVGQAAGFKRTEAEARSPARVEAVIGRVRERAEAAGLPPEVAERTWRAMIAAFIELEVAQVAQVDQVSR